MGPGTSPVPASLGLAQREPQRCPLWRARPVTALTPRPPHPGPACTEVWRATPLFRTLMGLGTPSTAGGLGEQRRQLRRSRKLESAPGAWAGLTDRRPPCRMRSRGAFVSCAENSTESPGQRRQGEYVAPQKTKQNKTKTHKKTPKKQKLTNQTKKCVWEITHHYHQKLSAVTSSALGGATLG